MVKGAILAGGLGTRLRPLTYTIPKPLLPLGDKPIIQHLIEWLKSYNIREIVIAVSYMGKMIQGYLGDGKWLGVNIEYIHAPPKGTAGQLLTLKDKLRETFALIYGDTITNLDLYDMIQFHKKVGSKLTIGVKKVPIKIKYGVITFDRDKKVVSWREKPRIRINMNIGVYVAEPKVFNYIPKNRVSQMNEVVKNMVEAGEPVYAYLTKSDFYDVGDYQTYIKLNEKYTRLLGKI